MTSSSKGLLGTHESRMEVAAVIGLLQQRQQINLQKSSVAEQQYTNFLLEQQASFNNQQELQRQKEKLVDLWCRELEHQGMSPLKAYGQAMSELELQQLLREVAGIFESYSVQLENGFEVAVKPVLADKTSSIVVANVFGAIALIVTIAVPTFLWIPFSVGFFYWAYAETKSKKKVNQGDLIANYQLNLTKKCQETLTPYLEAINELPKSKLFDDKVTRKILSDFVSLNTQFEL